MIATTESFIAHVVAHAGSSTDQADLAIRAVLAAIGGELDRAQLDLVADELPPALAAALCEGGGAARPVEDELCAWGVRLGAARELVASVCHALAEGLSNEALAAIRAVASPTIVSFLAADEVELAPPVGRGSTLATGRHGSHHPLSEGTSVRLPRG
ncbi:MAG: DUF2267 domain-containing protein [Kofleriaceae bacterium]